MKAWVCSLKDCYYGDGYIMILHAETRGKAICKSRRNDPGFDFAESDFTGIRARRALGLDDKPITIDNIYDAGINVYDPETGGECDDWPDDCGCELCRRVSNEP